MTLIEFGTQQCQFCPKVVSSRDGAHDFFHFSPVNKGGFPFSAKCRAIDFYRAFSFEIQTVKRNKSH